MTNFLTIFRREFSAYFATPLAAVFLVVFVALSSGMTFFVSGFFDRAQADLSSFFTWLPWLFLVLAVTIAFGLTVLYSASGHDAVARATVTSQLWRVAIGVVVMLVVAQLPPDFFRQVALWGYCGVVVLLNCGETAQQLLAQFEGTARASHAPERGTMDLRSYGVGAQILRDCGVHRMKLLGNPRRLPSMTGYGLEIEGHVAQE